MCVKGEIRIVEYEVIRRPFLLLETVNLLYSFVNGESYLEMMHQRKKRSDSVMEETVTSRFLLLQQIMNQVCQGLDPEEPWLQKYFCWVIAEDGQHKRCLARTMISTFSAFGSPDYDGHLQELCREWELTVSRGMWICGCSEAGLVYTKQPGCPGDLFTQIYALKLPAEFQMKLYDTMRRFPEAVVELGEKMRPIALRLESALQRAQPVLEEVVDYWLNSSITPLEFLDNTLGHEAVRGAGQRLRLAVSLMCSNVVIHAMAEETGRDYSLMCIGCCVTTASIPQRESDVIENLSAALKSISDTKRLEILRRLVKKPLYGLELAEIMDTDPGNLSRSLAALYNHGFLRQERRNMRTYYQTDRDGLQSFLDRLTSAIFE